jgi:ATP-dependent protease ClpP protease subunit
MNNPMNPETLELMRIQFEILSRQLEVGIDVDRRIITVDGLIDITTPGLLKSKIDLITGLTNSFDPITWEITSYGGSVEGMFGCLDVMNESKAIINAHGIGIAASAAAWILIAAPGERSMSKNASLMLHEMKADLGGGVAELTASASYLEERFSQALTVLAKNSNKSKAYWAGLVQNTLYMSASTCLEYGLIDKVRTHAKRKRR